MRKKSNATKLKKKLIRDPKTGRILKGVAQDTNKNGTAGQPTKYRDKYCKEIIEYFSVDALELIKDAEINGKARKERLPARMPWFEGFARKIGVDTKTLRSWRKLHPEFDAAYEQAKELQREFLVEVGLSGKAPSSFVIFTMKNVCGWRDERDLRLKEAKKDREMTDAELDEALFG